MQIVNILVLAFVVSVFTAPTAVKDRDLGGSKTDDDLWPR
jgi:hypothetical protein